MEQLITTIGIIAELVVLIFNILIFTRLTTPKWNTPVTKLIMYGGSALFLGLFAYVVYAKILAESFASFALVTLPTFILYFILSKYKDFRFFVTFCFLDTVTLIFTFFARAVDIWFGQLPGVIAYVALCVLMAIVFFIGKPWFSKYRELTRNVRKGWGAMAISTLLIYLLLIFAAAYPVPMIQRPEFLIVYAFMSVTILSCYVVFLSFLAQKTALADLNEALIAEKKWHNIAYIDSLTGLKNRAAYVEHSNTIERNDDNGKETYAVMLDIDNFKSINDTFGHHVGDTVLKKAANFLLSVFNDNHYRVFRIGGDEFAVIAVDITKSALDEKIQKICNPDVDLKCSFSCGYSLVDFERKNAMENAFIDADLLMYKHKESKQLN